MHTSFNQVNMVINQDNLDGGIIQVPCVALYSVGSNSTSHKLSCALFFFFIGEESHLVDIWHMVWIIVYREPKYTILKFTWYCNLRNMVMPDGGNKCSVGRSIQILYY